MSLIYNTKELINNAQDINIESEKGFKSGISNLDKIARIDKKQLCVLTGKANNGKTTFLNYYVYMLAKNANLKTLFLSFETDAVLHTALFLQYAERDIVADKFLFADTTEISTIQQIIQTIKEAKENYNIDNIVIDPFNYISTEQASDSNAICYILKALKQAAQKYNVSIVLVAHPKKLMQDEELTGESIYGSIHFRNVADIILLVNTDFKERTTTIKADKVRFNRLQGQVGETATLRYNFNGTYIEDTEEETDCIYNSMSQKIATEIYNNYTEKKEAYTNVAEAEETADATHTTTNKVNYNALMQTKVSYLNNVYAQKTEEITLQEALNKAANIQDKQAHLRQLTNKADIQAYKKNNFPAFAPSVVFNSDGTTKENIKNINNIICIDIDGQDNNYMTTFEMKEIVNKIPYVFYAQESCSGKGIFCLVQIADTNKFKEHFNALSEEFKAKGLIIDAQCKDINRKRFIAYDPAPYINKNALVFTDTKEDAKEVVTDTTLPISDAQQVTFPHGWGKYTDKQKAEYIVTQCLQHNIQINKTHADSLTIASALKTIYKDSDTGLNYCLQLRQMRKNADTSKQTSIYYNAQEKTNAVGCLVNLYKKAITAA